MTLQWRHVLKLYYNPQVPNLMYKVCTGYHGTREIEHGLCTYTVDNPLAKACGLSLRTGAQTMLYLSLVNRCSTIENMSSDKMVFEMTAILFLNFLCIETYAVALILNASLRRF